jgi:hypothetical protein
MNQSLYRARLGAVPGAFALCCLLLWGAVPIQSAAAAEAAATSPDLNKRFASVWRLKGDVAAVRAGVERPLQEGDPVFVGEHVRAASAAEAVLKTDDAGMVAVRPGAEFVAERFVAQGDAGDSFTMRLITGSLRVITGWIGHVNRGGHRIVTPTATIGIRGTDHEPFVLAADLAGATPYRQGTYDKVNRGGTTLEAAGQSLDIDSGRVGFARAAGKTANKSRALMTLLLPVLLDKVPDFYVPGQFDAELDKYSETADEVSQQQLAQRQKAAGMKCAPAAIARTWLGQLDGAIARRDGDAIVAMFAPDVAVRATVRNKDGSRTTVDLSRDELAQSTLTAVKTLTEYKQRRISVNAKLAGPQSALACDGIAVKSVVIEQGRQAGKRYRFESREEYVLQLQDGKWLATQAETTQR